MANTAQARKRARQSENRRQQNVVVRGTMRTAMKKVTNAIDSGDKEGAATAFKDAAPLIARMGGKGIISANKASRDISRLNAHIKAM